MSETDIELYAELLRSNNYNPAAVYNAAQDTYADLKKSIAGISTLLNCQAQQIIVTSGASESINTVLHHIALSDKKPIRILITDGEHDAIGHTLDFLQKYYPLEVDSCPLNSVGAIDLNCLKELLSTRDYDLFCFIHVNNLWGSINEVSEVVNLCRSLQPRLKIHLDAVQSIGKLAFNFREFDVDFATISGHKIGAPKGIGLLLVKNPGTLRPLIHGGGQQRNLRSGTENVPLVMMLAHRLKQVIDSDKQAYIQDLRSCLLNNLENSDIKFTVLVQGVPNILAVIIHDLRAETLLNILSAQGFSISAGSACNAKNGSNSALHKLLLHLPNRLDLPADAEQKMIRISLNETNTEEEVTLLADTIIEAVKKYGGF